MTTLRQTSVKQKSNQIASVSGQENLWASFRRAERREWWLWLSAIAVTLLLTAGVISFIVPELRSGENSIAWLQFPQAMRGLVAVVLLFDIYTIYQQWQIHRIRRELFKREELFRLISENAADMIAVVDMEGHRIYNSLSYQRVLGYSPQELQASESSAQIHPDDRLKVKQSAEEARASGIGGTLEFRMSHKDGTWRYLESKASVIRDSKGVPEKFVIVSRDVTERKQVLDALRLSDAGFRSVVDNAPYGIYRVDAAGRLLRTNPALQKMLGYDTAEELLGSNLEKVFKVPAEFQQFSGLLIGIEDFKDVELEWKRKDGRPITVRCSGRRVDDEGGEATYFEMFAEDITDKRILEKQLRMAGKMEAVGRLSGGIAHDFNNLLGVIIGYSDVLKRALGVNNPLTEHAVEIEKAGQRAAGLTRQLLAFSRQQILTPTVLNLNDLVTDMAKMLPRLIGEDIAVSIEMAPQLKTVRADRNQIEQVILNLAVNARDAMPQGGKLRIDTKNITLDDLYVRVHPGARVGEYVWLAVTDSGTGMNAETLAHIFEPFFTTKEIGKGTGLGLATVYGVVKQSGGYIWVDSDLGKGASFQIFLPCVQETAAPLATSPQVVENLRGTETILLAEDADALRKLAVTFLETHGFRVLPAPDAESALKLAAAHSGTIHMLVTDVVMPGENGRVLAETLLTRYPAMKVLYISGYTDSFIAGHGVLEAGCHLLHKPFTENELIQKVREVLATRSESKQGKPELVLTGTQPTKET
ncbi:MAG TPA: PAS domain S-box protein [Candidatus Dormibacteraeota bacterium]|nr:PAS domain S-box protein [Candidatus Dormibacteraeota bacterium]